METVSSTARAARPADRASARSGAATEFKTVITERTRLTAVSRTTQLSWNNELVNCIPNSEYYIILNLTNLKLPDQVDRVQMVCCATQTRGVYPPRRYVTNTPTVMTGRTRTPTLVVSLTLLLIYILGV